MAENEPLDLRDPRRWRKVRFGVEGGDSPERVAREAYRALCREIRDLLKARFPLPKLMAAADGQGADVASVVRQCDVAPDFAELFELEVTCGHAGGVLVEHVLWRVVGIRLDQVSFQILQEGGSTNLRQLRRYTGQIEEAMRADVGRLSRMLSQDPTRVPRLPSLSREEQDQAQQHLMGASLLRQRVPRQ